MCALQVDTVSGRLTPFKACREMPDSVPSAGAFASHTERTPVDQIDKIELNSIFCHAADEFPATVTCLFCRKAATFLPTDALADTDEYN